MPLEPEGRLRHWFLCTRNDFSSSFSLRRAQDHTYSADTPFSEGGARLLQSALKSEELEGVAVAVCFGLPGQSESYPYEG